MYKIWYDRLFLNRSTKTETDIKTYQIGLILLIISYIFLGKSEVYVDESHIDLDFISQLSEDDPKLIKIIQHWFLESPSPPSVPYVFENKNPNLNGQIGQPQVIDNILNHVI